MAQIILPKTLQGHTPALADDVMADLNAIVARLNNGLEADNVADGSITTAKLAAGAVTDPKITGPITISKLAAMATGKIIAGSGGTATALVMAGAATIGATGLVTIGNDTATQPSPQVCGGTFTDLPFSLTLPDGVWIVSASARMSGTDGASSAGIRLLVSLSEVNRSTRTCVGATLGDPVEDSYEITELVSGSSSLSIQGIGVGSGTYTFDAGRIVARQVQ